LVNDKGLQIPKSVRTWFLIHFVVDYLLAIPLFIAPQQMLLFAGWGIVDPVATRLVAAALFAIGGVSLFYHKSSSDVIHALLTIKIIWSGAAILGLIISLFTGASALAIFALVLFIVFANVWAYYKIKLQR
jgi:NADH:ubiquinone oxidoreductase subunit K